MKLLKPSGCLLSDGGGNVKEQTMIVEEQGIGFRTGVRFPSGPLKEHWRTSALSFSVHSHSVSMEALFTFVSAVMGGVICHYIIKRLDGDDN